MEVVVAVNTSPRMDMMGVIPLPAATAPYDIASWVGFLGVNLPVGVRISSSSPGRNSSRTWAENFPPGRILTPMARRPSLAPEGQNSCGARQIEYDRRSVTPSRAVWTAMCCPAR